MSAFVVYAVPVADGILAIAPLPGRDGRYAEDLAHIRDWKPALVISTTTQAELESANAQDLGADLQNSGTRWVHFPVSDFNRPDPETESAWPATSQIARAALRGGGRVLIHCKGACGRSGMVALRLMIELGEDPIEALQRLRSVRACAVETEAQLRWARHD